MKTQIGKNQLPVRTQLRVGEWGYPGGPYIQTCKDIEWDEDTGKISARCQKKNGSWNDTTLTLSDSLGSLDVENCDGVLHLGPCIITSYSF